MHGYCNCMGTWLLEIDCATRGYLGWVLWVDLVTWRDGTLCHASLKPRYYRLNPVYRVLPDETIQESPESSPIFSCLYCTSDYTSTPYRYLLFELRPL
eukprot:1038534-Amorphochlora_amoeboformis.AAC.1